ncbi:MAG: alpha/beta-type small acid-soluble spore protein [Lachnospiraceae bacterium]|nr:alpha/beta-type small acid-soluble spore protein [Lachnospiraceae bacterium]
MKSAKKPEGLDLTCLTEEDKVKLEIAEEIGVFDKVVAGGWRCLSARESGRIGGILSRRRRQERAQKSESVKTGESLSDCGCDPAGTD